MFERTASRIGIANIEITALNTDTLWAIPKGCVWFTMQCRTAVPFRVGLEPDKAASSQPPYLTIKSGTSWNEKENKIRVEEGQPIFFAAAVPCVIEIVMGIATEEVQNAD